MFRLWLRIALFLSSYSLLFVILIAQHWGEWVFLIALGVILVLVNSVLLFIFRRVRRKGDTFLKIKSVNNRGWENLGYIFTYAIPFLNTDISSPKEVIALTILVVVIGFFYVTTNMIHVNPTLNLFGYNVYTITTKEDQEIVVISKKSIKELRSTKAYEVAEGVFIG